MTGRAPGLGYPDCYHNIPKFAFGDWPKLDGKNEAVKQKLTACVVWFEL